MESHCIWKRMQSTITQLLMQGWVTDMQIKTEANKNKGASSHTQTYTQTHTHTHTRSHTHTHARSHTHGLSVGSLTDSHLMFLTGSSNWAASTVGRSKMTFGSLSKTTSQARQTTRLKNPASQPPLLFMSNAPCSHRLRPILPQAALQHQADKPK